MENVDVGVLFIANKTDKEYTKILGRNIFLYALDEYLALSCIKRITLVVENIEKITAVLTEFNLYSEKLSVIKGDRSRNNSIKLGLQDLQVYRDQANDLQIIVLHDASTLIFSSNIINKIIVAANHCGAAGTVTSLSGDIFKNLSDNSFEDSLSSSANFYNANIILQAFRFQIIYSVINKSTKDELENDVDCLKLVLKYCGIRGKLLIDAQDVMKLNNKKDIYFATSLIKEKSTKICIISEEETEAVSLLIQNLKEKVANIERVQTNVSTLEDCNKTFNSVIIFHLREIQQDQHLLNYASLIDLEREGLIIHIIDNASVDGLQKMSIYNLHRNSRKMAHNYEKLRKGVVVIQCVSSAELDKLIEMVSTLMQTDPLIYSGQTFFL